MKVILSPIAQKQLLKLPTKEGLKVTRKLRQLEENPFSGKLLTGKLKGFYSFRSWPYRIIYQVFKEKKIILIDVIQHRRGVYK